MSGPSKEVQALQDELAELAAARSVLPAEGEPETWHVMRPWQRSDGLWSCSVVVQTRRGPCRFTVDGAPLEVIKRALVGCLKLLEVVR